MAKISAISLIGLLALLVGCQAQTGMVGHYPAPNFNGPNVVPQMAQDSGPPMMPWVPPAAGNRNPKAYAGTVPRGWVPSARARDWKWIVVHHSATPAGSAAVFDREHKEKGWDGLGYDFVIGNGTNSGNGQVEIGYRWTQQLIGAHAKTADNRFNEQGIGICLVGNFDLDRPTSAQLQSLAKLVAYLEKTYRISPDRVLGHRDTKPTDCPGRNINIAVVRRMASSQLAESGEEVPGNAVMANGAAELLKDSASSR